MNNAKLKGLTGDQLRLMISFNDTAALWSGLLIIFALAIEVLLAWWYGGGASWDEPWPEIWGPVIANASIAVGVYGEIHFGRRSSTAAKELQERSDLKVAEANARAAEANKMAEEEKLARLTLESRLQLRSLNQEQWDFIQELRGTFARMNIGYETDAETWWFAGQLRDAFFSAGMLVGMFPRDANVHSFGTLIFEPKGFDGARPRTVEPLVELFKKSEERLGALAIVTSLPKDIIQAPNDVPMIIVGGRMVLPLAKAGPKPKP